MVAIGLVGLFVNYQYLVADRKKPPLMKFVARAFVALATRSVSMSTSGGTPTTPP
jgi:hypothetical protein